MNEKSIKSANNILNVIIVTAIIAIIGIVGSIFFSRKGNIITSKNMTAEEICNELKNNNNNIGKIVVYTEETDSNNLLGRPNQYTSKVNFADNRISQEYVEENDAKGGTIEVFNNKTDMKKRKEYIEQISNSSSIFAQYIYSKGNVLLRLEKDLTPEQAQEYEKIFNQIVK
jgi:hypothetical protein|nr:MAG TPA: hypothetical protein [Caudoviricetes sp.]